VYRFAYNVSIYNKLYIIYVGDILPDKIYDCFSTRSLFPLCIRPVLLYFLVDKTDRKMVYNDGNFMNTSIYDINTWIACACRRYYYYYTVYSTNANYTPRMYTIYCISNTLAKCIYLIMIIL